jgi:dynein heavy chain
MDEEFSYLIGEVFAAAAILSYLGPFTGQYRKKVVDNLKKDLRDLGIPFSPDIKGIDEVLCEPIEVQNWRICGLPSDNFSITNATIVTSSLKRPLMIDPQ